MRQKRKLLKYLIWLFILVVSMSSLTYADWKTDYCASPPFIPGKIQPNLLLLIDNSASMYDLEYIAGSLFAASSFSCKGGVSSTPESFCMDDTYTNSKICSLNVTSCTQNSDCTSLGSSETCTNGICTMPLTTCTSDAGCPSNGQCINYYYGYFEPETIYQYQLYPATNKGTPAANDYFAVPSTSMPAACNFGGSASTAPYVCVNYDNASSPTAVTAFYATGNFLNWLSASKFDVEKKVLTGGKFDTTSNLLIGESRGCDGRRFVKLLKTAGSCTSGCTYQPIAFATRGPNALDPDNVKVGVDGGLTRIEIYAPSSTTLGNIGSCQCAAANWNAGNFGQAQTQTTDCLGSDAKSNTLNHSLQSCWVLKDNINKCIGNSNCSDSVIWQGVNNQDVTTSCENSYIDYCGGNNSAVYDNNSGNLYCTKGKVLISNQPSGLPAEFKNDAAGDWICTNQGIHNLVPTPYDVDGNNTAGYVGNCAIFVHKSGNCNSACASGLRSSSWNGECMCWDDNCVKEEILHYCYGAEVAEVTDPSQGSSNTVGNVPSILVDSFTQTLGTLLGTFYGRVSSAAPVGIINTYSDQILFGAMTFNYNAANSECNVTGANISCVGYCSNNAAQQCKTSDQCTAGASCVLDSKTDGGHIISNIGTDPGSHSSGLIKSIDNVQATAWTPFAEAFYTAIGYYAAVMVCSNNTSQSCTTDSDCTSSGLCVYKNVCVNASSQLCTADSDCPSTPLPQKCGHLSRDFRLQTGTCSSTTSRVCKFDSNCPSGETCNIDNTNNLTGDYNLGANPSVVKCQPNNILLISDGASTADLAPASSNLAGLYKWNTNTAVDQTDSAVVPGQCPSFAGSRNLDDLAYLARNWNIKKFSTSSVSAKTCSSSGSACTKNADCPAPQICINSPQQASEYINTYVVYTGPLNDPNTNQCNPKNLMNDTAAKGGTTAALTASNPAQLQTALSSAFAAIAGRASSGTAASVLASGEGSGANLVQAIFFPSREFASKKVEWTGKLQNFWYYIDPRLGNSTIIEDTVTDKALNLLQDNAVSFVYDSTSNQTTITTTSPSGVVTPNVSLDGVHYLWEAGNLLLDKTAASRSIYTPCDVNSSACIMSDGANTGLMSFSAANLDGSTQQPYLQAASSAEADNIVNYIRGTDISGYRPRSVPRCSATPVVCTTNSDCPPGENCNATGVWKLGDIVNSTPKILSWVPINTYYELYNDATYKAFTNTSSYKSRGLVFAGANDGMLHAFKLGLLGLYNDVNLKATLGKHCSTDASKWCNADADCSSGTCALDANLGQEMWAFIPKNSLPYLKYFADPNYCHIYYIDAQPFVFDASIGIPSDCSETDYSKCSKPTDGSSWRTVLIGSMRLGGACKNFGDTCPDCTKTPMDNVGYSSYFALDITDPLNPRFLWEFSNPGLGFSTSGPAIVRVGTDNTDPANPILIDRIHNGRWFAVFGSGPTGWISNNNNMAIASNLQTMKLFVIDVATGELKTTIDTGEQGAFAGSLLRATMDFDQGDLSKRGNYQDDAVYFGYTKWDDTSSVGTPLSFQVPAGGTSKSVVLAMGSLLTNDSYKGKFIELWKKDSSGNWTYQGVKLIISYNGFTRTATIDSSWPGNTTPDGSSNYQYRISNGWTKGGVKRLLTNQDIDPTHWAVSTVIDSNSLSSNTSYNTRVGGAGIGPVTASVKKLQNYIDNSVRLYFGSGRYYYRISDLLDDPSNLRALYSIIEPCFKSDGTVDSVCTAITSGSNVATGAPTVSNIGEAATGAGIDLTANPNLKGWWITLDGCRDSSLNPVSCKTAGVDNPAAVFKAERLVTEPLAATSGAVFFSTITPTSDPCEYGGRSYLWAVRFDTGGTLVPFGILKGKAIIQRSTGEIEQIDLATAFATGQEGQRKTTASFGLTGSGGISIIVPPKPLNQILHIKKR